MSEERTILTTPESSAVGVTCEQESAFDELFSQCCPEGQKYASVQSVVTAIMGIRKEGDEESGMGLLCSMLRARATDGQLDRTAYKKVIEQWIHVMTGGASASGEAPTMTSSPIKSYSATMSLQTSSDYLTPQGLHFYSHESLEADGGSSSLADSFDPTELQQNVEQLKSENFRLREHQSNIEMHWEQREESLKKFFLEKEEMERKLRLLMQQLEQKEEEREDLSQQVSERDCTNDILNKRLQEVEHERAALSSELCDVRRQLEESHRNIHQLESTVGELQMLHEEKERRMVELQANLDELEEKLGSVVEEKEELGSQLCSMKEDHVSLQHETKQMEQELEATKTELRTRSFIASTPTHSSTPLGLAPPTTGLVRHKSIMEEIQDTNFPPGEKSPLVSVQTVDLADSLEQSMGSSLEVSLVSLESSSILEDSSADFQHYEEGAIRQLQDLLGLNSSFSLREHPSIRVVSSQDVTQADLKWGEVETKLMKLLTDRKKLLEKLQSYREKVAELKRQIAELKKAQGTAVGGKEVEQLVSDKKDLRKKVAQLSHELSLEKGELMEAKRSVEAKRIQVVGLQGELEQLQRSHNELQKECSRLEQKCRTQEGCVLALESTVGQVEQRCRELERQVKGMQWKHKRAMKAIFNIVMEKEGEEGEGSLMGMEEEEVDVSANDSYEEEEILTVVHVADLLKERLAELKSAAHGGGTTVSGRKPPPPVCQTAVDASVPPADSPSPDSPLPVDRTTSQGTQTPTRRQVAMQLTVDEQRQVEITPAVEESHGCHDNEDQLAVGPSSGRRRTHSLAVDPLDSVDVPPSGSRSPALVQETLPPLTIPPMAGKAVSGGLGRLLVKEDQGSVTVPSSSSRKGRLFGIWRLILGLLFFLVLVLGLFVTLTTMYDGRYCDEPCPSSISSLVYHAFYPHISVGHNGLRPY